MFKIKMRVEFVVKKKTTLPMMLYRQLHQPESQNKKNMQKTSLAPPIMNSANDVVDPIHSQKY